MSMCYTLHFNITHIAFHSLHIGVEKPTAAEFIYLYSQKKSVTNNYEKARKTLNNPDTQ